MVPQAVTAALAALMLLAACGSPSAPTEPAEPPTAADLEGAWQLAAGILGGHQLVLVDEARVTLILDEDGASGKAACNHYFGDFHVVDGRVDVAGFGQTEMACAEPAMAMEVAYLSALSKVETAQFVDAALVLSGSPDVELRFERLQPPPVAEIVGTPWLLESLVDGDAMSSVVPAPATLLLNADGSLEGSTGCRTLSGHYMVRGDEIWANEFGAAGACPPGDARAQDSHVIGVIGDGFRAAVDGASLILADEDGRGLVYRAMR